MEAPLKKLMISVARLAAAQNRAASAGARAAGVNATSWAILCELYLERRLTNGQIAERLGMSTGGVTPALDRLAGMGLLERTPNPADRRSSIVMLTEAGWAEVTRSADALADALEPVVGELDEGERDVVLRFVEGYGGALQQVREGLERT